MSLINKTKLIGIKFVFFVFLIILESMFYNTFNNIFNNVGLAYIASYLATIIIIYAIYHRDLNNKIKDIKKLNKRDLLTSIIMMICFIFLMYISNYICNLFTSDIADNEKVIRELLKKNPIFMSIATIIFAPITEELLFRYNFFDKNINRYFSLIFSAILFSSIHVLASASITSLIYFIPYFFMGLAFGIGLCKTDNVFVSITFHILHNFLTVMILFI